MSRHVVGTFGDMREQAITVGHQPRHEPLEIDSHIRIGVLAQDQRSARVMDENVAEAEINSGFRDQVSNFLRDFVSASTSGRDLSGILSDHRFSNSKSLILYFDIG